MPVALSLYFSMKSVAPENAIWLMYLSISSSVSPMPWSEMVMVLASLSMLTLIVRSPRSPLKSPTDASVLSFCVASTAFEISSRRKISWSLYRNFLMMGNMFSVVTPIFPFCMIYIVFMLLSFYGVFLQIAYHANCSDILSWMTWLSCLPVWQTLPINEWVSPASCETGLTSCHGCVIGGRSLRLLARVSRPDSCRRRVP